MGVSKISPIREQKSPTSPDARDDNEPQIPHISPSPKVGNDANDDSVPLVPIHERGFKIDPNNTLPFTI